MTEKSGLGIYLGKEGKVFGPFSSEQLESLKKNGDYILYSWFWDGSSPQWVAINPPPIPVPALPIAPEVDPASGGSWELQVICHDKTNLMSGRFARVRKDGVVFEGAAGEWPLPPFRKGARVWLNLLDDAASRSENVEARIEGLSRKGDRWIYEMSWAGMPRLVAEGAVSGKA